MKQNGTKRTLSKKKLLFIKKKLIQFLIVQIAFLLCLGYVLRISQPVDLERAEVIVFTSDSIWYNGNSQFIFEQNNDFYTLVWYGGKGPTEFGVLENAVAPMIEEEQLLLTVEKGFLTNRKFVVDIRSDSRIYFDIEAHNRSQLFNCAAFTWIGVCFTLLNIVGHAFYIMLMTGLWPFGKKATGHQMKRR